MLEGEVCSPMGFTEASLRRDHGLKPAFVLPMYLLSLCGFLFPQELELPLS